MSVKTLSTKSLAGMTLTKREHVARVKILYKRILKNQLDWVMSRPHWYHYAEQTRQEFERHRYETNPAEIDNLVAKGEQWLAKSQHPDPYHLPWNQGASKFQRNVPPPLEVVYQHGAPEHHDDHGHGSHGAHH